MRLHFAPCPQDAALLIADTQASKYHICKANGLVSWWSEFCDEVNYVDTVDAAEAAASLAHLLMSLSDAQCAPISVWPFADAPAAFRDVAQGEGNDGWVAVIKAQIARKGIPNFLGARSFARRKIQNLTLLNGDLLLIARKT